MFHMLLPEDGGRVEKVAGGRALFANRFTIVANNNNFFKGLLRGACNLFFLFIFTTLLLYSETFK